MLFSGKGSDYIINDDFIKNINNLHWKLFPVKDLVNTDFIFNTETPQRGVSTIGSEMHLPKNNTRMKIQKSRLYPNSLGSIIGQFKSVCTKKIRAKGYTKFGWQSRYYDRIIKSKIQLNAARQYIKNNPKNWING